MGLLASLLLLLCIAIVFLRWVFKEIPRHRYFFMVLLAFIFFVLWGYVQWGSAPSWFEFQKKKASEAKTEALLKRFQSPEALIRVFREKVQKTPNQAEGWFLLGRLYASQNQWRHAHEAYLNARALKPHELKYELGEMEALWNIKDRRCDHTLLTRLHALYQTHSDNMDILAMLAWCEHQNKHHTQAVVLWKKMLTQLPEGSAQSQTVHRWIVKAQKAAGDGALPQDP